MPETAAQRDRKFEGEMDARTLANATEIIGDKARHNRARSSAKKLAQETKQAAANLAKVSRQRTTKKTTTSRKRKKK